MHKEEWVLKKIDQTGPVFGFIGNFPLDLSLAPESPRITTW